MLWPRFGAMVKGRFELRRPFSGSPSLFTWWSRYYKPFQWFSRSPSEDNCCCGWQVRQGVKLNEKLVVRFYKEHLDGVDGQTQVTQTGPDFGVQKWNSYPLCKRCTLCKWMREGNGEMMTISNFWSQTYSALSLSNQGVLYSLRIKSNCFLIYYDRDISMRDDSSVYSVTNRNTFGPSIVIDIPRLLIAVSVKTWGNLELILNGSVMDETW